MLKSHPYIFKHFQYAPSESHFGVHHGFFNRNGCKAFFSADPGDRITRLAAGAFHNHRPRILRVVCIPHVDRYAFLAKRENGVFVQNRSPHIGKLPHFPVCDRTDRYGIFDNARVSHQKTGDIRPVFIQICMACLGNQRSRDIGTAA